MAALGLLKQLLSRIRGTVIMSLSPTGGLDIVEFDVTTRRSTEDGGAVVDFPVEDDESGTDNYDPDPTRLTFTGVFTDTPVQFLAGLTTGPGRARSMYAKLLAKKETGEPQYVFTDIRSHSDMVIESVVADEDADTGEAIPVTVTLKKSRILTSAFVPSQFDLDAQIAGATGTIDFGRQSPINPFDYAGPTTINPF